MVTLARALDLCLASRSTQREDGADSEDVPTVKGTPRRSNTAGMNWTPTGTIQPAFPCQLAVALPMPEPHMLPAVVMQISEPVMRPRREAGAISA